MPENLDSKICLSSHIFFGRVELGALVHVVTACLTSDAHRKHHAHFHGVVLGPLALRQLRRIEIRREVLVEHLAFTHVVWVVEISSSSAQLPSLVYQQQGDLGTQGDLKQHRSRLG